MASTDKRDVDAVVIFKELSLNNEESGQFYSILVPERLYNKFYDDTSGVMATLLFQTIVMKFTSNGVPNNKKLDYTESLQILSELNLLDGVALNAEKANHINMGIKTKFDRTSVTAYSKDISDETISAFAEMAPNSMSTKQKVRFMEILAASMPDGQTKGRTSLVVEEPTEQQMEKSNSQESTVPESDNLTDSQSVCGSEDSHGQDGRVIWTHEAILLLLDRRRALSNLFESSTVTQRQAWRKVAEELKAKGYRYGEDDCNKKFRSLRARHKTIKEKNKQTGNSRQSWRYFDAMEEMFAGDPAVLPTSVVSSMRPETVPSLDDSSQVNDDNQVTELPLTSTRVPRKRRRSSIDYEEPPIWFEKYQQTQKEMHDERISLERRRVSALETLVQLLQKQ